MTAGAVAVAGCGAVVAVAGSGVFVAVAGWGGAAVAVAASAGGATSEPGKIPLLAITAAAIDRGVDVRGLFHWTGVDNYEWLHGYDVAFGIIDRDRNVRPSAQVLQAAALG